MVDIYTEYLVMYSLRIGESRHVVEIEIEIEIETAFVQHKHNVD